MQFINLVKSTFLRYNSQTFYVKICILKEEIMKAYVVFWSDTFDDWRMEKVFNCEEKARQYIKDCKGNRWHEEMEVE